MIVKGSFPKIDNYCYSSNPFKKTELSLYKKFIRKMIVKGSFSEALNVFSNPFKIQLHFCEVIRKIIVEGSSSERIIPSFESF